MFICEFIVCYVCSGLCDELITRTEDSYRARARAHACVRGSLCDLETSITGQPRPEVGCSAIGTIGGTNNSTGVCVLLDLIKEPKKTEKVGMIFLQDVHYIT
jgi:hypothetical protein